MDFKHFSEISALCPGAKRQHDYPCLIQGVIMISIQMTIIETTANTDTKVTINLSETNNFRYKAHNQ